MCFRLYSALLQSLLFPRTFLNPSDSPVNQSSRKYLAFFSDGRKKRIYNKPTAFVKKKAARKRKWKSRWRSQQNLVSFLVAPCVTSDWCHCVMFIQQSVAPPPPLGSSHNFEQLLFLDFHPKIFHVILSNFQFLVKKFCGRSKARHNAAKHSSLYT